MQAGGIASALTAGNRNLDHEGATAAILGLLNALVMGTEPAPGRPSGGQGEGREMAVSLGTEEYLTKVNMAGSAEATGHLTTN